MILESRYYVNLSDFRESLLRGISLILECRFYVNFSDFRESILGDSLLF